MGWNRCAFTTMLAAACGANDPAVDDTRGSTSGDPSGSASLTATTPGSTDPTTSSASTSSATTSTDDTTTTSGCDPTNASRGSDGGESGTEGCASGCSTTEPECEPEWSNACGLADAVAIELPAPYVPGVALLPAPGGGATFVWGHIEDDVNGLLRVDGDGQLVWSVETELRNTAAATADDGSILASGVTGELGSPVVRTLGAYASDGTPTWSRSEEEAAELEDADCPLVAHDPAVGWLVGCSVPGEVGGDGILRIHTYDDDGALIATVPTTEGFFERMAPTGDGRVVISGAVGEPRVGYLASVSIATGAPIWELETDDDAPPAFAIGSPGVAMLLGDELHGIDGDGVVVWSTPIASELECNLLGANARVTWTGAGFLVAGAQPYSALTVVHHVAADGSMSCGDGPQTPTGVVAASARVFVAEAEQGGWVAGTDVAAACAAGSLWMFRSSAP